jgi:hypothetical protein
LQHESQRLKLLTSRFLTAKEPVVPALDRQDNVFVLDIGDGENRFHPDWIASVNGALAAAQAAKAGDNLGIIKTRMYAPVLAALRSRSGAGRGRKAPSEGAFRPQPPQPARH